MVPSISPVLRFQIYNHTGIPVFSKNLTNFILSRTAQSERSIMSSSKKRKIRKKNKEKKKEKKKKKKEEKRRKTWEKERKLTMM